MKVLLCLAALLGLSLGGDDRTSHGSQYRHGYPLWNGNYGFHGHGHQQGHVKVFGFPGSDPRCHKDGDIVMDPDNRCQVYRCVMKHKKHGYDDKHVYKYFDVELVNCPKAKLPAHVYPPHHAPSKGVNPHGYTGYGHGYGHGYGYKVHEVEVQTAISKYNHAHYLATHVKGQVAAVCGDYAYKPEKECVDVQRH